MFSSGTVILHLSPPFAHMPSHLSRLKVNPFRLAYIAVVTFAGCMWGGIWLIPESGGSEQIEAVIRVSNEVDWETRALNGPLLTSDNLKEALHRATGSEPLPDEIASLQSSLRVKMKQSKGDEPARIRLELRTKHVAVGERLLGHLAQIAVLRLNATQFPLERSRIVNLANAQLNSAQQRENAAQAAMEQFVSN